MTGDHLEGPHQPYWDYVFDLVAKADDPKDVEVASVVMGLYPLEGGRVTNGIVGVVLEESYSLSSFRAELLTILGNAN